MATLTQPGITSATLTIDEYLHSSFHPDCDFVDDHIEERHLGELEHSNLQGELYSWFRSHRNEWNIRVQLELRTRVSETRVRVPDLCILSKQAPREQVVTTPAILAIEILSPEDRMPRVLKRLDDFLAMGVQHLLLFEPLEHIAYTYTGTGPQLVEVSRLTLPNSPIYIDLPELFSALD